VLPTPGKERITIRIDTDIVNYFSHQAEQAGGGNYQTTVNAILREHVQGKKIAPKLEDISRRVIREELGQGFLVEFDGGDTTLLRPRAISSDHPPARIATRQTPTSS
jgi:hypothetical protein